MKNFTVVFIVIMMLVIVFTASVFPQIKENLHRNQKSIQEKIMELERGKRPHITEIIDEEMFQNEQQFSISKERDKETTKLSKILSDTMYVQISDVKEIWDTLAHSWVFAGTAASSYDSAGNQTEYLYQLWDGSAWVNNWKYTYDYDIYGNRTARLFSYWVGHECINQEKCTYTYDLNGDQLEALYQIWNGNAFENDQKYTFTYDTTQNQTTESVQGWNDGAWVDIGKHKTTSSYDAYGNCTMLFYQNWNGNTWDNIGKSTYTYDGDGTLTEDLYQMWSNYEMLWVNGLKYTFTCDTNRNQTNELLQHWYDTAWVNYSNRTFNYETNGNRMGYLSQRWNNSMWVNSENHTFTWQMLITDVNDVTNVIKNFALSPNYPNPFNPQTKISFSVPKESFITLKVYDVLGREVATLVQDTKQQGEYTVTWNADNVPSGVYFYKLLAGDFVETKKMVLMK
jgi:hypothetical protein